MLAGCTSKTEKQARDAFLYGYPLVMTEETRQTKIEKVTRYSAY